MSHLKTSNGSDRNGNLFLAENKDGKVTERKVPKADIKTLEERTYLVEDKDEKALAALKGKTMKKVDILSLMAKHAASFKDYSLDEKAFLPKYAFTI